METVYDKVAWSYFEGRRLLMVRPKGKNYFINPGGKRELIAGGSRWESDEEVLDREISEELSVVLLRPLIFDGAFRGRVLYRENTFVIDRCYRSAGYDGTFKLGRELAGGGEMRFFRYHEYVGQPFATPTGTLIFDHYRAFDLLD